jgi:hypothetical protein
MTLDALSYAVLFRRDRYIYNARDPIELRCFLASISSTFRQMTRDLCHEVS